MSGKYNLNSYWIFTGIREVMHHYIPWYLNWLVQGKNRIIRIRTQIVS